MNHFIVLAQLYQDIALKYDYVNISLSIAHICHRMDCGLIFRDGQSKLKYSPQYLEICQPPGEHFSNTVKIQFEIVYTSI